MTYRAQRYFIGTSLLVTIVLAAAFIAATTTAVMH